MKKKNNNNNSYSISEVIYYLNGATGEDDEDALTFDVVAVDGTVDVIG